MEGLVPTFGIDGYGQRLEMAVETMTSQLSLVEALSLGVLGLAAAALLLLAVIRHSAVAAVSFSFVSLSALIVAMLFGRLDFITSGTKVLILCLYLSSILLFLTATVRMARDNAMIGLMMLVGIAAMLALGGASMMQMIDGWALARLAVVATTLFLLAFLFIEFFRGDRGSIAVTPGLLLVIAALPAMSFAAERAPQTDWLVPASPILLMTVGVLLAAFAAQLTASSAPRPAPKAAKKGKPRISPAATIATASGAAHEGPLLREIDEDDHAGGTPPPMRRVPGYVPVAARAEETDEHADPAFAPSPSREPARTHAAPPADPQPEASRDRFGERSEPVSAQWGGGQSSFGTRELPVGEDEYVWDMMADREVRMGRQFADMMAVGGGILATPDVLRDLVADHSLAEFDEAILGGGEPSTGRFQLRLDLTNGQSIGLDGRRVVDNDGLMYRLELRGEPLGAAPMMAPSHAAPTPEPAPEPSRGGLAAVAAAKTAPPREEAPLTAPVGPGAGPSPVVAALDEGRIGAWFQPIIRLSDRATVGFEALARWELPDGTVREASEFIGELIEEGRGPDLARIVVDQAAAELSAWVKAEPGLGQFVAVNIAAADMPKEEVAEIIGSAVRRHDLPAGALVVEITEDRIQASQSRALAAAKAIRQAGASLAVDDFGVGYSTLGRLSKFRFDIVKLDRSLIEGLSSSKKQRSVIRAMLSAAEKAGAPVVAEGIEDEATAEVLVELGCDFGQGFLFGKAEKVGGNEVPTQPQQPQADASAGAPPVRGQPRPGDLR